jgi:glycyl-tRNA synthetase beta subunit
MKGTARGAVKETAKGAAKATVDFLFEIGCEELPAGMIPGAAKELKAILEKYLSAYSLSDSAPLEVYGAPRRLAVSSASVRLSSRMKSGSDGPPKSVAYDPAGKPTRAAESFRPEMNVPLEMVDHFHIQGRVSLSKAGHLGQASSRNT